jgi:uncharacterized repeat protein (TIGR01451 family)
MRRRQPPLGRGLILSMVLAILVALATPGLGLAQTPGIALDRSPAPPQAIKRGAGAEQINFEVVYATTATRYVLKVTDPQGSVVLLQDTPLADTTRGQNSPLRRTVAFTPSPTAVEGRYTASLEFYSAEVGLENTATTRFDVANDLGSLRLEKFEDLNGNGARETGEPGVPNWRFSLVNPFGAPSQAVTGPDGTITIPNVPAGSWAITEGRETGWLATTPETGTVQVAPGATGVFTAGNVRPSIISGIVWIDVDGDGVLDREETGRRGNVTITLRGTTGQTASVSQVATTIGDGTYSFPDLRPGTYSVTVTRPDGFRLTTPVTIAGIGLVSNVPKPNNNFGLQSGTATAAAAPDVTIKKTGPAFAKPNEVFSYRIVVKNTSTFPARQVVVTDPIPEEMSLVEVPAGAKLKNGVVTWNLGTLNGGDSRILTMKVRLNPTAPAGRYTNTATVTAQGMTPKKSSTTLRVREPATTQRRSGGVTG